MGALVAVSGTVQADEAAEAQRLLARIADAARTLSYEGTFIYRHHGNLETLRVVHAATDGGVRERLYSLTGTAREILRDREKVTCILGDNRSVVVDRRQLENPLDQAVPADVAGLSKHYRLDIAGEAQVAGREAIEIGIWPRDEYRYGHRLWVDEQTGLLLRSDLVSDDGTPVEQLMFTELEAPAEVTADELQPAISGQGFTWYEPQSPGEAAGHAVAADASALEWRVETPPPGFELAMHEVRRLPGSDGPVEHLLFSDGLSNVSVYVEETEPHQGLSGHSRMGAVNAVGRRIGNHQVTVVGEVPRVTVEQLSDAVVPSDRQ